MSERFLKLCFRLLEVAQGIEERDKVNSGNKVQFEDTFENKVQSKDVAILLRFSLNYSPLQLEDNPDRYLAFELGPYDWHTLEQFDLLVDYHVHVCDSHGTELA